MDIQDCIPKDKHDMLAVEQARTIGFPALNPIIPDLLRWVQDANWPVAEPVASILADAGPEIVPHIKHITAGDDAVWKYWVILLVVERTNSKIVLGLQDELKRLANEPDHDDTLEGVDRVAQRVLMNRL